MNNNSINALQLFVHAMTENYVLDSLQNLLFSIACFHKYTRWYPHAITVIGYKMKRRRFMELHHVAVLWHGSSVSSSVDNMFKHITQRVTTLPQL